ncbi:MAG TPA: 2-amino-4-hydroxy-6-hydroxymethyldihydropteridine diphosphokinase [Candidatus Hydrogenedentes bacterium]|nr:2-amino-4-hydroxy-6-hydroxymethyldihydropteridine diphosphokinase [Candidatus Hydrogenedentota bacterium]
MMRVHLSLGSNVGDRKANLEAALDALGQLDGVRVTARSSCYETEPVGVVDQPAFLNMAAEVETVLEPLELYEAAKEIEKDLGREPTARWGPRTIDIDIVLWGDRVLESDRITLPHREFRNRAFVLAPLAEIAPDAIDPVTGETVAALAARPQAQGQADRVQD